MPRVFRPALAVLTALTAVSLAPAENWPQFRGPAGTGHSTEKDLPLTWGGDKKENVLWQADLLGEGTASPIVWKDRVFVLTGSRKVDDLKAGRLTPQQYLACYSTRDGKLLWNTTVAEGPWQRGHAGRPGGGVANCTPATDGERVYALFGTSVLVAIDFDGKLLWRKELVPHTYDMEMATSPVLFRDLVIVYCAMKGGSRLVAFHRRTGETVWDKPLKDTGYGHNTPLILQGQGKPRMVLMGAGLGPAKNAIQGFDPETGERLWWCAGKGETASAVPVGRLVYCDSGRGGPGKLIDPSGTGNITGTHVKWEAEVPGALSSPLAVGDYIYRLHDSRTLSCWDAKTGEQVYQQRVNQISSHWASPVADGAGNIYLASAGTSLVIKAGPRFEILAVNKLNDSNHASPAVADGRLYLMGTKRLHAVGRKE
jgi:outer membrane protein assembly factor BamB